MNPVEQARTLVRKTIAPQVRGWEATGRYPRSVAASSGLTGLFCPAEAGGLGLSFGEGMAVFEELGRGDAAFAFSLSMHNAVAAAGGHRGASRRRSALGPPAGRGRAPWAASR